MFSALFGVLIVTVAVLVPIAIVAKLIWGDQ
jgi:hypothetical protein